MNSIREDLESFRQFADSRLDDCPNERHTLDDYFQLWRRAQEREETLADIRRSVDELETGDGVPLSEVQSAFNGQLARRSRRNTP